MDIIHEGVSVHNTPSVTTYHSDYLSLYENITMLEYPELALIDHLDVNTNSKFTSTLFDNQASGFHSDFSETSDITEDITIPGSPNSFMERYNVFKTCTTDTNLKLKKDDIPKPVLELLSNFDDILDRTSDKNVSCDNNSLDFSTADFSTECDNIQHTCPNSHPLYFYKDEPFQLVPNVLNASNYQTNTYMKSTELGNCGGISKERNNGKTIRLPDKVNVSEYYCEYLNWKLETHNNLDEVKEDRTVGDIIADQNVPSLELEQISKYTVDCVMGTCDTERMSLTPTFEKMRDSFAEITHAKSGEGRNNKKKPCSKKRNQLELWQFIMKLLSDPNNACVRWINQEEGLFKFTNTEKAAYLWGKTKNNGKMKYENMSRCIRNYYPKPKATSGLKREGIIKKPNKSVCKGHKLVYQFTKRFMKIYFEYVKTGIFLSKTQKLL